MSSFRVENHNSITTENALLSQYDKELAAIEERKKQLKAQIETLMSQGKALSKKRAVLAKIIQPVVNGS